MLEIKELMDGTQEAWVNGILITKNSYLVSKVQDISTELDRVYTYYFKDDADPVEIEIDNPVALIVRDSGAHVVVSLDEEQNVLATYLQPGWTTLAWEKVDNDDAIVDF